MPGATNPRLPLDIRQLGTEIGVMEKHPCAVARDKFEKENADLFEGPASGQYLRNRILRAYERGWFDRDGASACGTPVRVGKHTTICCVNPTPCAIPGHAP